MSERRLNKYEKPMFAYAKFVETVGRNFYRKFDVKGRKKYDHNIE